MVMGKRNAGFGHNGLAKYCKHAIIKNAKIPDALKNLIIGTFTYTIDLSSCKWDIMMKDINRLFPHLPKAGETYVTEYSKYYNDENTDADDAHIAVSGNFVDWTIFNGTVIILHYDVQYNERSDRAHHSMYLRCLNTKKDKTNLHKLLKCLVRNHDEYNDTTGKKYANIIGQQFTSELKTNRRKLDTIFIPAETTQQITESIRKFIDGKEWYKKHSIPYHFGMLLYGPPGTGKSSIVKALTEEFNCYVYYIKQSEFLKAFTENTGGWMSSLTANSKISFVVIEDIDRVPFCNINNTKKINGKDDELSSTYSSFLGQFLNVIDGANSPSNVIWIFTTNHIDELEPALIRPGRIDLKIEIGYITNETFSAFLMHHFGKGLPDGYEVGGGYTFAQIQTDIMTGKTFDEIVEKYCNQD